MNWMSFNHLTTFLTYTSLYLAIVSLWVPGITKKLPLWITIFVVSVIFGLLSNRISFVVIIYIVLLGIVTFALQHNKYPIFIRVFSAIGLLILGFALGAHKLPGFHNLPVLDHVYISKDGAPFTLYLNFDKTLVGLFILGISCQLITTYHEWGEMLKIMLPRAVVVIFVLIGLSFAFQFVKFDPKLPASLLLWALTNLLFVCVAEEAFFRGFVQKYLCTILEKIKYGDLIAIIITSILFGLAHYAGGIRYVILASIAGLGYGWIYFRTRRIEASIITHFFLNLVHILFFTYPALANAFA